MVTANNYKAQIPNNVYAKSCKSTFLAIDLRSCLDKGSHNEGFNSCQSHVWMLRGKRKFVLVNLMSNGIHKEPKNRRQKNKELGGFS